MKIIFLGAPGSGKGTQAKEVITKLNIPHISTGDIFRKAINEGTEAGKIAKTYIDQGILCPDDITLKIVEDRIKEDDCKNGFLFDGFPRTIAQAEGLDNLFTKLNTKVDKVIYLEVDEEVLVERVVGREVCPSCGASFHETLNPSKIAHVCDFCSSTLVKRKDDNEETLRVRYATYMKQTAPLIDYYKDQGNLVTINAMNDIEKVTNDILEALRND